MSLKKSETIIDSIARVVYNTNGWTEPSGPEGKSLLRKTFECQHGFGHEEWMCSPLISHDSAVEGFSQAFIQTRRHEKISQKFHNVALWMIDRLRRKNFLVGFMLQAKFVGVSSEKINKNIKTIKLPDIFGNREVRAEFNTIYQKGGLMILKTPVEIPDSFTPMRYYQWNRPSDVEFLSWIDRQYKLYETFELRKLRELTPENKATMRSVMVRTHQTLFRNALQKESQGKCMVTGIAEPSLLFASHIKPFFDCEIEESYDASNGLLLARNIDALFDLALISFDAASGKIIYSQCINEHPEILSLFGIRPNMCVRKEFLNNSARRGFLRLHNEVTRKLQDFKEARSLWPLLHGDFEKISAK